jgi:GNAT superfamily N-acetyltransferase
MRQPLEDKVVTISRAQGTLTFPANFMLIAAMNPLSFGVRRFWSYQDSGRYNLLALEWRSPLRLCGGCRNVLRVVRIEMTTMIRPVCESDLTSLRLSFVGDGEDQAGNLQAQESGDGLYLVLWRQCVPLGHLFLRWAGSHEIPRIRNENLVAATVSDCPSLDGIWVRPDCRSEGIGTQLIREAERLALLAGFHSVCLTVDIKNDRARALYERLGYADPGIGPFHTFGTYTNPDGEEVPWDNGTQLFLRKRLAEDGAGGV